VAGVVLVAVNLRPAIAGVGPVVADIRADTGLPNFALGLLTTLPLLAFGVVSVMTPLVTRRVGMEWSVALALALIFAGTLVRAAPSVAMLYLGTGVFGVGIALGNVLLPAITKRDFPRRSGGMTSLYSSVMGLGATLGAGLAAPLAVRLGWRGSLGIWAVPVVAALLVWLPQLGRKARVPLQRRYREAFAALGRSALAWQVALFMGFQSLTFYVILAWLPDLLQARGMTATAAGGMLALSQATGVLGTAVVPVWAGRWADQTLAVWGLGLLEGLALVGLLMPGVAFVAVSVAVLGFVLGGTFGLALLFLVVRAGDAERAGELSGMAQSVGYLMAAVGPAAFGALYDATGEWRIPLAFLGLVLVGKVGAGVRAGRAGQV
jgi:CP family cyanate transporter-like MFS transporter